MNLCNDKHDEVCYEDRNCPVCESKMEIDRLEREIEKLRDENKGLEEEIENFEIK